MRVALLGPVRVLDDTDSPVDVRGARLRMLAARLALAGGAPVPADTLVADLWGTRPPADAAGALHALVYRLRRALGGAGTVESAGTAYRLAVDPPDVDAYRFEDLVARAGREPRQASELLGQALRLWRGPALADVGEAPFAAAAAARLDELRVAAVEDRFEAELLAGRHGEILADLEAATREHPLRERLAGLRMRALHAAGRQSEALAVYEQVRTTLAGELGVDPGKDLREAHLAVVRGEVSRAAPGRLPARLTTFVGRDDELALLAELLERSRLVTVAGPGGAGKTRLAVEAMSRKPRDRTWFVPLTDDDVPGAILGVLSSPDAPRPTRADPVDRVAELLGGGPATLILDNAEQVAEAVARYATRLLERLPRLTILVTSRESLDVVGEALCRLRPLAPPAAARLFLDRARAVRPGLELDEAGVADICRRLDGLPLALELAAARLRSMDAGALAAGLDDWFRLLSSGNRGAQPRQRTLHAVIDWSWNLLDEEERTLARRLSVFPGTFGVTAAERICADRSVPPSDVAYVLGSLVDKSIIELESGRYRMLRTIRDFADRELGPDRAAVREAYVAHFAALAAEHDPLLRGERQDAALTVFESEYDNLVHALHLALAGGAAGPAVALLGPLYWYWNTVHHDARDVSFVARLLELGDALPADARAAFTAVHLLSGSAEPEAGAVRAVIEDCLRTEASRRFPILLVMILPGGYLSGLDDLVAREIAQIRARPDRWARGCTYLAEGFAAYDRGDWRTVEACCEQAVREFEAAGDRLMTAMTLGGSARVYSLRGEHEHAIAAYERGVALIRRTDPSHLLALALERMRGGDLPGARRDVDEATRAAHEYGQSHLVAQCLVVLADWQRRAGDPGGCERTLAELEELTGTDAALGTAVEGQLVAVRIANLLATGDASGARALLPRAVRAWLSYRDGAPAAQALAAILLLEGDPAGAATALGMSQVIRGTYDHGDPELRALAGELASRLGEAAYREAFDAGAALPREDALDRLTSQAPPGR
ncbi:ATP-binding protein [Amycolatopsis suaedae]|uniref:AfsR/SARP family transcriptional regulator n=1 Tax=Amycolatopsis suaedae TaxID=2510978 RepID=A0A4Q7J498_9PSEU|nr:BTAD domain-containing putative transcriptional regulator [Amycolatopsis suaedae]RZQ62381.1 AfsR/SARP family transcriptional regulator [Amycolatopsis suaedae]